MPTAMVAIMAVAAFSGTPVHPMRPKTQTIGTRFGISESTPARMDMNSSEWIRPMTTKVNEKLVTSLIAT